MIELSGDVVLDLLRVHAPCPLCACTTPEVHTCELCKGVGVKADVLAAFRSAFSPPRHYLSDGGFAAAGFYCDVCGAPAGDEHGHTWEKCAQNSQSSSAAYCEQWLECEGLRGEQPSPTLLSRARDLLRKLGQAGRVR